MNIAVIGTGYVGLVTGACFSVMGNKVICVDIDANKIENLNKGIIPIYELSLKKIVLENVNKTLFFTTDIYKAINESNIVFMAVGTPMSQDGSADLSAVFMVAKQIGQTINTHKIIVSKSTVPVGTCHKIKEIIQAELDKRNVNVDFDIVSNPEFLKEGNAVSDFMKPDRVVIGAEKEEIFNKMRALYNPFFKIRDRFITMDIRSAEMTKYAANALLATKISFINEIANICEKVGADVNNVRIGIGSDTRIGYSFIYPGIGYGGTCFPKDVAALIKLGKENDCNLQLVSAVDKVNKEQKYFFLNKIINRFGEDLSSLTLAIWGLSFKPETDDMREAPSIFIVNELIKRGAKIKVYDPKAMREAENKHFKDLDVFYGENKNIILKNADALILLTEWKVFRSPDFNFIKQNLKSPIIFDARNQYTKLNLQEQGFEYYQVGKK
jgi:UDPglucose 6-dehydrogenase